MSDLPMECLRSTCWYIESHRHYWKSYILGNAPGFVKNRLTFLILCEIIPKSSLSLGVNTERAWFNASVDIYPRFTQFVFEATRGGTKLSEDEGDIAIDDLALSTSQCLSKLKALLSPLSPFPFPRSPFVHFRLILALLF